MRIRGRLILHYVGLAAAPLALTALVLAWQGLVMLHAQAEALLEGVALSASHRVEAHVSGLQNELRLATRLLSSEPPDREDWTDTLNALLGEEQRDFFGLALLEADGKILARAGRFFDEGLTPKLRLRHTASVVRSTPGGAVITIAVPLPGFRAGRAGFLAGSASLGSMAPMLEQMSRRCQGEVMLADMVGEIMLRPAMSPYDVEPGAGILNRLDITADQPVPDESIKLTVQARQSWTVAFRPALRAAVITITALLLSLAVSALLGLLASRRITRPLESLARAAKLLQNGDLSARAPEVGSDELASTAQAFNAMASQLSESLDGLREQVAIRKQMEAKLRVSEATARSLINASLESAFLVGANDTILTANAVGAEQFGLRPEDMENRPFREFMSDDSYERHRSQMDRALQTRKPVRFENIRSGRIYDVLISPIHGRDAGEHDQVAIFSRDITATRIAEQSLMLHKTRLEALVALSRMADASTSEVADFALDKGIELTSSRHGFLNIRDNDTGEFVAYSFSRETFRDCSMDGRSDGFEARHGRLWEEALRRQEPIIVNDNREDRPENRELPPGHVPLRRFIVVPLLEGSDVTALVGVSDKHTDYDFTDAIQLTLLMDGVMQHLRRITAARQLQRARDEALSANEAKSEFLAHMSHEIRTPLQGVIGLIELSLQRDPARELARNLELVRDASHSMLTIVNDILDFSRIEAGKLDIVEEDVHLRDLLDNVRGLFSFLAKDKGVVLSVDVDPDAPIRIRTDPDRLRQILANLVSNAVKFTDDGEVKITARLESGPENGRATLALAVSDTGPGIPETKRDDIFEAFEQADALVARRHGGTGLGLAICTRLARLMHGALSLDSVEQNGSTFTFRAEFEIPDDAEDGGQETGEPPEPARPDRSLHVLLAEDTLINQVFIEDILSRDGHKVTVADNGAMALEAMASVRFDIVLMDVQMPEMDGLEATRRIRQGESGHNPADLPIIALTAYAMEADRQRILQAGVDEYLSKPVQVEELLAVMARVLHESERPEPHIAEQPSPRGADQEDGFLDELSAQFRPEVVREMLDLFEKLSGERMEDMRRAMSEGNVEKMATAAHALAGAAGTIRAMELAERARRMQGAAKEARDEERQEIFRLLEEKLASVREAIRAKR